MNIGNPAEMTVLELAQLIRELTGSRSQIRFVPRPTDDPPCASRHHAGPAELGWNTDFGGRRAQAHDRVVPHASELRREPDATDLPLDSPP